MMAKLAVAQTVCVPGDVAANTAQAVDLIELAAAAGAELICLPECLNTGLDAANLPKLAEEVPGPFSEAIGQAAKQAGCLVVCGMAEREGDAIYNAAVVTGPDGKLLAKYRKCYLYLQEAETFSRGDRACVVDFGFATGGVAICYDYVFPEYIRDLVLRGARLLVHPTAWVDTPDCREWHYPAAEAYRAQCQVRALENGIFVMSANHSGAYDTGGYLQAVGRSAIIAPWGEVLAEVPEGKGVAVAEVDFAKASKWAETAAPYLRDFREVPRPL
ncbi:MAG: carbon-nitrogen hydrolase family protein [Armatimonadia bacterium]